jgi:nucleoside phosphorylase
LAIPNARALKEVLIFTSTPNEFKSVSRGVGRESFKNLACAVIDCGPGRINATFKVTSELIPRLAAQKPPLVMIGTGTSGSLSLKLKHGDTIVSNAALISDWRMEKGQEVTVSPYGEFDYRPPKPDHVEKMTIYCQDDLVIKLLESLPAQDFLRGNLLTSEAFVSGTEHKLALGLLYNCLACDMESGVYGFIANNLVKVPWFNVRTVADTLEDTLKDYFTMEKDFTEVLGGKIAQTLRILDSMIN